MAWYSYCTYCTTVRITNNLVLVSGWHRAQSLSIIIRYSLFVIRHSCVRALLRTGVFQNQFSYVISGFYTEINSEGKTKKDTKNHLANTLSIPPLAPNQTSTLSSPAYIQSSPSFPTFRKKCRPSGTSSPSFPPLCPHPHPWSVPSSSLPPNRLVARFSPQPPCLSSSARRVPSRR